MIPKDVLQDEQIIKDTWGGVREQAFVLCAAENPEKALQKNDILFQQIRKDMPDVKFLSLAPLIPSQKTQQENLSRWSAFWNDSGQKAALRAELQRQGSQYGFNALAFEPFLQWLDRPRSSFTLAEFERDLLSERIRSALAAARAKGKQIGRRVGQRVKADRMRPKVLELTEQGATYRQIARQLNISKNTVTDIVKRHRQTGLQQDRA